MGHGRWGKEIVVIEIQEHFEFFCIRRVKSNRHKQQSTKNHFFMQQEVLSISLNFYNTFKIFLLNFLYFVVNFLFEYVDTIRHTLIRLSDFTKKLFSP